jgi:hypothetical protein
MNGVTTREKHKRLLGKRVEAAANGLINYARQLISQEGDLKVIGRKYECTRSLLDYLVEASEYSSSRRRIAVRIIHAMIAVGLRLNVKPVIRWKRAIMAWNEHHKSKW